MVAFGQRIVSEAIIKPAENRMPHQAWLSCAAIGAEVAVVPIARA